MKITIINGPNLNLLGQRETSVYGYTSFDTYLEELKKNYAGHQVEYFQSNVEGELISEIQRAGRQSDAILLNAGAYTHTSLAIADAVAAITVPVLEIHISNIFAREDYRHVSFVGARCRGSISGLGLRGYDLGLHYFTELFS